MFKQKQEESMNICLTSMYNTELQYYIENTKKITNYNKNINTNKGNTSEIEFQLVLKVLDFILKQIGFMGFIIIFKNYLIYNILNIIKLRYMYKRIRNIKVFKTKV